MRAAAFGRTVSAEAWRALSERLGVEEAALRAVAAVESAGSGFLAVPSELPKVLFEGHAFHRLTRGRFDSTNPDVSYPKWDKTRYAKTAAGEWARLEAACALDRGAALQSASWGAFQIMGFNHRLCGCADVEAFVTAQRSGADRQVECFAQFISRPPFLDALRERNWVAFARAYNGPGFALNRYDEKLAAAYEHLATAAGASPPSPARRFRSPFGRPMFGERLKQSRTTRGSSKAATAP